MADLPNDLIEKEAEVLRLLSKGFDAKSVAAELGLSVNTVNERLRSARAKMGATSSRAAARSLVELEAHKKFGDKKFVIPPSPSTSEPSARLQNEAANGSRAPSQKGLFVMVIAVSTAVAALVAASVSNQGAQASKSQPRVIATSPASNATIRPGAITISVTFDQPMRANSYSFVKSGPDTFPQCGTMGPVQSHDGKSFSMSCTVAPSRSYEIWFNRGRFMNFMSAKGVPATPFRLRFRTQSTQ